MSRIAVLIPVFNEERVIRRSLSSVVTQSVKPAVVLIGDNESTDATVALAREVLEKARVDYEIVRAKRYPELGKLNININLYHLTRHLSKLSRSLDYVAVIEADVVLERRYFEKLVRVFGNHEKLCIAGGVLKPFGLPRDAFPLIKINVNLYGCNRVYRAGCWFTLNTKYDIRLLPAWDTDHVVLALYEGYHVYQVRNALSIPLRGINPFKGRPKGFTDALHGLPLWWALYKTLQYRDLEYLSSYIATRISGRGLAKRVSPLRQVYRYTAHKVLLRKALSTL
jgi:glycosyltransferase involved in cell wall biosynthesis